MQKTLMKKAFPLYYETLGHSADPCIILIMGLGGQLTHWPSSFTQGLVAQGFYVVTFDHRDVGLSPYYDHLETPDMMQAILAKKKGQMVPAPYTLKEMAADVIALMKQLEIVQAHVVGISMGGIISQILALEHPEQILSLTCIASTSSDPQLPAAHAEIMSLFFLPKRGSESREIYLRNKLKLHELYTHPDTFDAKKVRDLYIKTYQRAYHPQGTRRQLLALMNAESRTARLRALNLPSLIIHGDYDPVYSLVHGRQLASCIQNSQFEIIEKMGHDLAEINSIRLIQLIASHCKNAGKHS